MERQTVLILLLLFFGCGGPQYPDSSTPPPKPGVVVTTSSIESTALDTLRYMSDMKVSYYKEIKSFILEMNDSTIIVDGNKFQIIDTKRIEKDGKIILSFHVAPYSGLHSNISTIMAVYNEERVVEIAISPLGIFSTVRPDQWTLQEPSKKVPPATTAEKPTKIHVVGTGQTLSVISRQYKMTVKEIRELNSLRTTRIIVGQKLKVYAN